MESFDIKISHVAAMEMYEDNLQFFFTDTDYALEADGAEESNSESWIQKFIAKIVAMIKNAIVRMKNWFARIMETDSGFEKELRLAELGKKPRKEVNIIGYKYIDSVINAPFDKLQKVTKEYVNRVNAAKVGVEDPKLAGKSDDIIKDILKQLGSNMEDPSRYFDELTTKFRGKKMEQRIPNTAIPNYTKMYKAHHTAQVTFQKYMNELEGLMKAVETNLRSQSNKIKYDYRTAVKSTPKGEDKPDKPDNFFKRYLNNLMKIYNFNVSFCNFALSLKTEQALAARAVLKRFFYIGITN